MFMDPHFCFGFFSTLREEHWMDFDAGPVPQPLGQLGEVEALQAEADLQVLAAAFHLVRHWHVCRREGERGRGSFKSTLNETQRDSLAAR